MIVKKETYVDTDRGFTYRFYPVEDTIKDKKTNDGYEVKYLIHDPDPITPAALNGYADSAFLVHYHRDFYVAREDIVAKDDVKAWYQGEKIEQEEEYYIYPVSALIHDMVHLELGITGFMGDPGGWDTSHCGAVFVSKSLAKNKKQAENIALSLVEDWNTYLSGDTFCVVQETYDKNKNPTGYDISCGYYSMKQAEEDLD